MIKSLLQAKLSGSTFSRSKMSAKVLLQRFMSSHCEVEGNFVHPCIIDGRQSLVHATDLAYRDADYYRQLTQYAQDNDYLLIADRRSKENIDVNNRRRSWLLVMTLSVGLNAGAIAQDDHDHPSTERSTSLGLFESNVIEQVFDGNDVKRASPDLDNAHFDYRFVDSPLSEKLESILLQRFFADDSTPDYVRNDLRQMARYFSQYPNVVALIDSLSAVNWRLIYQENTFATQVRGNAIQVQGVEIRFDPRAAAQLRAHPACASNANACIASPADALLHELLHARSALLDTKQFIAQGGLSRVIYPYAHEHAVIQSERKLYRDMSLQDGVVRPQRNQHAGRLLASSCTVCIN